MSEMKSIDLNLDAGEGADHEEQLFELVTSVNIACGGHAGDESSMRDCVRRARDLGLTIGAHPSFPDREGFGREVLQIDPAMLASSLAEQIRELIEICRAEGARLSHVKPHGALYNLAAHDSKTARSVIEAVTLVDKSLAVVGLAGSPFLRWCGMAGLRTLAEGFVDRQYEEDGTLRSRELPGALIEDASLAAEQALSLVGRVDTLCIHGDTPQALRIARAVCARLTGAGIKLETFGGQNA